MGCCGAFKGWVLAGGTLTLSYALSRLFPLELDSHYVFQADLELVTAPLSFLSGRVSSLCSGVTMEN